MVKERYPVHVDDTGTHSNYLWYYIWPVNVFNTKKKQIYKSSHAILLKKIVRNEQLKKIITNIDVIGCDNSRKFVTSLIDHR